MAPNRARSGQVNAVLSVAHHHHRGVGHQYLDRDARSRLEADLRRRNVALAAGHGHGGADAVDDQSVSFGMIGLDTSQSSLPPMYPTPSRHREGTLVLGTSWLCGHRVVLVDKATERRPERQLSWNNLV